MELIKKRSLLRGWALKSSKTGIAVKEGESGDGDSLLWAGLLSLSGESLQNLPASQCMDKNGKWWRSPERVNKDTENSCSRDMFLGAMAYILAQRDLYSLSKTKEYLDQNETLCNDATDSRCKMSLNMKSLLSYMFDNYSQTEGKYKYFWRFLYLPTLILQALFSPKGYQLHLVGVQLLLLRKLNILNPLNFLACLILNIREPKNLLFMYLAAKPKEKIVEEFCAQVPWEEPKQKSQWSIEREYSEHAFNESMCWEFIFILNLIIPLEK